VKIAVDQENVNPGLGKGNIQRDDDRSQKVERFPYGLADEIIDGFWKVVEGWNRRKDESDWQPGSTIMQIFIYHEVII